MPWRLANLTRGGWGCRSGFFVASKVTGRCAPAAQEAVLGLCGPDWELPWPRKCTGRWARVVTPCRSRTCQSALPASVPGGGTDEESGCHAGPRTWHVDDGGRDTAAFGQDGGQRLEYSGAQGRIKVSRIVTSGEKPGKWKLSCRLDSSVIKVALRDGRKVESITGDNECQRIAQKWMRVVK